MAGLRRDRFGQQVEHRLGQRGVLDGQIGGEPAQVIVEVAHTGAAAGAGLLGAFAGGVGVHIGDDRGRQAPQIARAHAPLRPVQDHRLGPPPQLRVEHRGGLGDDPGPDLLDPSVFQGLEGVGQLVHQLVGVGDPAAGGDRRDQPRRRQLRLGQAGRLRRQQRIPHRVADHLGTGRGPVRQVRRNRAGRDLFIVAVRDASPTRPSRVRPRRAGPTPPSTGAAGPWPRRPDVARPARPASSPPAAAVRSARPG